MAIVVNRGAADPIRIVVVDDHPVVRAGVRALLADAADVEMVGEAEDGNQAVEKARRLDPDVILMDLRLPGLAGVEATRRILAMQPEIGIVALTSPDAEPEILAALEAGALGFLSKTSSALLPPVVAAPQPLGPEPQPGRVMRADLERSVPVPALGRIPGGGDGLDVQKLPALPTML